MIVGFYLLFTTSVAKKKKAASPSSLFLTKVQAEGGGWVGVVKKVWGVWDPIKCGITLCLGQ